MASVTLAFLQPSATPAVPALEDGAPGARELQRVADFEGALQRQIAAQDPVLVAQAVQPTAVASDASDAAGATDAGAADARARQGLNLDGTTASGANVTGGDMILDGLERLRGVFDARESRVSEMMEARSVDSRALLAMQVEVAEFTMLVDITSKLTGKSTQIFDTLMKGQ